MNPTFLIAATSNWMPTARLGIALSKTGSYVEAVCPANHLIRKSSVLRKAYTYKALSPLSSFRNAILASHPNLIVSADDLSTHHLIDLHAQGDTMMRDLIERSLGPPESFPFMTARASFMNIAREEGVVVPNTIVIRDIADLEVLGSDKGFPIVLKSDGSSSGEGTKVAHNFLEAKRAYRFLQRSPSLLRIVKRVLINRDLRSARTKLRRPRAVVNAQNHIRGRDTTSLIACWKGEVLGALHFEVIEKQYAFGPASVMKVINNPEIETSAARIVKKLKLSGLHGFDFLLEEQSGLPYMIEFNPRATQVGHLTLGAGRDLPGAIYAAVTGTATRESPRLTNNSTIALFPQEFMRDPESPFLKSSYHDTPGDEPELTRACLRQGQKSHTQHFLEACLRIVHPNYRLLL